MEVNNILPADLIHSFCQKYHIKRMSFFGSVVRDDFGPDSDVDILVEFEANHSPGYEFFRMESELSQLIGRDVDLLTINFLNLEIRNSVQSEAVAVYDQA